MKFADYLKAKKIDQQAFAKHDSNRYAEFLSIFEQIHQDSFTAQKLFLINQIRKKYPLIFSETEETKAKTIKAAKPKVNVKPKMKKAETPKNESGEKPKPAKPKVKPVIRKK